MVIITGQLNQDFEQRVLSYYGKLTVGVSDRNVSKTFAVAASLYEENTFQLDATAEDGQVVLRVLNSLELDKMTPFQMALFSVLGEILLKVSVNRSLAQQSFTTAILLDAETLEGLCAGLV